MQTVPYCGTPPLPGAVHWNLDPWLIATLLIVALAYVTLAPRHSVTRGRQLSFHAGWAVLSLSLISPLCNLSVALFSARVGQHMLIEFVAAPLLAVALPALTGGDARTRALLGALPFAVALWFWHLPDPYQWTFTSTAAYWAMHVSLIASAVLLWRVLLDTANPAASLMASAITTGQMTVLGAVYTFAHHPFFTVHFGTAPAWGFSPLEDQQLGGLIMWIPPGVVLAAAFLHAMASLLSDSRGNNAYQTSRNATGHAELQG